MRVLRERNFRLLFLGRSTSALGDYFVPVALVFAVLKISHSAADLGYVLGVQALAQVLFLLIGGVVADRFPRRRLMMGADTFRGAGELILGFILIAGHPPVALIAVLGAAQGIGGALFSPAATGLTANVVPREHLQQANSLFQTAYAAAAVTRQAIAGVCVVTIGSGWAILADGVTFFINVVALAFINAEIPPRAKTTSMFADLKLGWVEFSSRKWIRTIILGATLFNLLYGAYTVVGPVASLHLYDGAAMWATVSASAGFGAIAGGVIAAVLARRELPLSRAVPLIGLYALTPMMIALHLDLAAVAVAAALGGAGLTAFSATWNTAVQKLVPEHLLSRVFSYDYFGSLVALPVGLALSGALIPALGIRPMLWIIAAVQVLTIAVVALSPSVRAVGKPGAGGVPPPGGEADPEPSSQQYAPTTTEET